MKQALLRSAFWGDLAGCQAAVSAGADINSADREGATALHLAAMRGHAEVCGWLVQAGIDIDARDDSNKTALHYAVFREHIAACFTILAESPDLDAQDYQGWTPLHGAAVRGNAPLCEKLLAAGAANHLLDHAGKKASDVVPADKPELLTLFERYRLSRAGSESWKRAGKSLRDDRGESMGLAL